MEIASHISVYPSIHHSMRYRTKQSNYYDGRSDLMRLSSTRRFSTRPPQSLLDR